MKPSIPHRTPGLAGLALLTTVIALASACSNTQYGGAPPFYTLSGTVSGLNASGLVLANAGQTISVNSGAQSFSFGPALLSGASYEVTVQAQPAGQLCSVADGSGATSSANVANVVVTCAERAYDLGGTVRGLNGSGLVLANGSETLSVAAGATTFAFATPVAQGSTYSVAVRTQPAGLACAVAKGMGTMPSGNVSSVAVSCTDQPFSLGGSISGLTTSGLELVNGADLLDVAANATSFKMPTAVPYGSAYAVTVHAEPTGLSCAVNHGAGTMPATAVTSVSVVCADRTYALSGSISGLTASGLVLANGTDTLPVSANATAFMMPTEVPYGSPYAVTVQTQPTGLTCTPGNATGTMPADPVSNVTITCAPNTFTIGGSISGLTTTGLVLTSGTDATAPLAANATMFSLPAGLTPGSTYNVIVQTQPAGQLCTVTNGAGTVGNSDVTNVAVSCTSNVISYTTPGSYSWTVPDGVTSIQVVATGGGGGGGSYAGGNGGVVTATLSVTPGQVVPLFVGGGGATSFTGGGGGSSNVDAGAADQVIAGGGGGSGGGAGGNSAGGNGGGSGTGNGSNGNAGNPTAGIGGNAGIGGAGGPSGEFPPGFPNPPTSGAGTAGGNGNGGPGGLAGDGSSGGGAGGAGSGAGTGGAGGTGCCGGGGGGGYGGGGGAGSGPWGDGGGGGGGSTGPAGATFAVGTNGGPTGVGGGDGSIAITTNP
jgi:hypothetical protein